MKKNNKVIALVVSLALAVGYLYAARPAAKQTDNVKVQYRTVCKAGKCSKVRTTCPSGKCGQRAKSSYRKRRPKTAGASIQD